MPTRRQLRAGGVAAAVELPPRLAQFSDADWPRPSVEDAHLSKFPEQFRDALAYSFAWRRCCAARDAWAVEHGIADIWRWLGGQSASVDRNGRRVSDGPAQIKNADFPSMNLIRAQSGES